MESVAWRAWSDDMEIADTVTLVLFCLSTEITKYQQLLPGLEIEHFL
jgi:hypothetical protein